MGIGSDIIELLIQLRLSGHIRRRTSIIEIGAQQLAGSFTSASGDLERLRGIFGVRRSLALGKPVRSPIVHGELEHLDATAPAAREFWNWLGFQYAAIDIDGSAGSIRLDLNFDDAPTAA